MALRNKGFNWEQREQQYNCAQNNTVRNITAHRKTKHIAMNVECLVVPRRFVNGYQYFGGTY
jgi:hypothetical protein